MRFFHYKELLKLYAINYKEDRFAGTRNSMYAFLIVPGMTSFGFAMVSPFSIFRPIAIFGAFGGCFGSFLINLKEELGEIAMKDKEALGDKVRYRYQ